MALLGPCHICMHAPTLPRRRSLWVSAAAGKGFGGRSPPQNTPAKEKKKRSARRGPRKQNQFIEDEERRQQEPAGRGGPASVEQRPQTPREREFAERYRNASSVQQSGQSGSTNSDFERKLSQLAERRRDAGDKQEGQEERSLDVLAMEPQFGRPEPKQQGKRSDKEEPQDEGGFMSSGPAKVASLAGAVVLIVIFLVSSVGLDSGSGPPASDQQVAELGEQQYKQVEAQAARFEEQLKASPDDIEALEGAAVAFTKLGDREKATTYLVQLSKRKPDDPQVLRLLAETQAFQGEVKAALATYQTAVAKTKGKDVDLVSGLATTLVEDGKPQQAVEAVKEARQSSGSDADLGVDLDLVLARTFSKWKGHDSEALAIYERLAETSSDDFRIPLAKGLLLKGRLIWGAQLWEEALTRVLDAAWRREGRKGDAQRAFMKARYLAPSGAREAVDSLIARQ